MSKKRSPDPELCRRLTHRADQLCHRDPARALELAERARDLAAEIDRSVLGEPRWNLLQAKVWSGLASALRSVAELKAAEDAVNVAFAFLRGAVDPEGSPLDPMVAPRLARRAAYLRGDQGRFAESLALIQDARRGYERLGRLDRVHEALVDQATLLGRSGNGSAALPLLARALRGLDPERQGRAFLAAVHNMALYLNELASTLSQHREALAWLRLAIRLHHHFPEELSLLKLKGLEGLTMLRLECFDDGLTRLWNAYDGFGKLGAIHDQVILLLHLAEALLKQERFRELRSLAGRLFPIVNHLRFDRPLNYALIHCYNILQGDALTRDQLAKARRGVEVTLPPPSRARLGGLEPSPDLSSEG